MLDRNGRLKESLRLLMLSNIRDLFESGGRQNGAKKWPQIKPIRRLIVNHILDKIRHDIQDCFQTVTTKFITKEEKNSLTAW